MAQTYKDYLHIKSDKTIAGKNYIDWRAKWLGLDDVEQIATAQIPGGPAIRGEWVAEGGDATLPPEDREPRILAKKGKLRVVFSGTNITARIGVNPGWGVGQIWIDDKRPTEIPGLSVAQNEITCNSEAYGSFGNEYLDVTIADNLPAGDHVLEIYCNNPGEGVGGFVVVTGFKVFSEDNKTRNSEAWIEPRADLPQKEVMRITNMSGKGIHNVALSFPSALVDESGNPLSTVHLGTIDAASYKDITIIPNLDGHERESVEYYTIPMHADYEVDNGQSSGNFVPNAVGLTYTGNWSDDINNGEHRQFSSGKGASMAFVVNNDHFTLRMQKDFGWGSFLVMVNPIVIGGCGVTTGSPVVTVPAASIGSLQAGMYVTGTNVPTVTYILSVDVVAGTVTMSAKATGTHANRTLTFETMKEELSSHSVTGGGYYENVDVQGLALPFGNKVRLVAKDSKPAVWSKLSWPGSDIYDPKDETLVYTVKRKHVPPFPTTNVRLEDGRVEYKPVWYNKKDLTIPYDNRSLVREEIVQRFPTFLVIYQPGYQEIIKQYDVAVLDPFALTRKQVIELQNLGIKVIVYVSFGEEDSTLLNKWNPNSDAVPWKGDGQGPGGYASYYMKGGYDYGEMSECGFDRQRLEGVKACAKGNANYNPNWSGRCTSACSKDWREGYIEWEKGNKCGGGYSNTTFWQRDASTACSNRGCPKYTPANNKCSQYERAEAWGQDFSLASDFPDENGIWASYYVNAVDRGPNSWYARIRDYYLPLIFDEPTPRNEVLTIAAHESDPGVNVLGIELSHAPLDEDEELRMIDVATGYEYQRGVEWSMDSKLGTITISATEGSPPVVVGQQIRAIYSTKGLGADGVFMDTVDTVDVYPREVYQDGAAGLINDMKKLYPDKAFCSNRGFSILDKIIHSCSYVMFETFLSEYDWEKKVYFKIGPESTAWNDQITSQLFRLRRKHVFDVIGLNYASNGPEGDELRQYIREETTKRGWLSWSSEILLNRPLPNQPYTDQKGPLRTNMWRAYKYNKPSTEEEPTNGFKRGELSAQCINTVITGDEPYLTTKLYEDVKSPLLVEVREGSDTSNVLGGIVRVFYDVQDANQPKEEWTVYQKSSGTASVTATTLTKADLLEEFNGDYGNWDDYFNGRTRCVEIWYTGSEQTTWQVVSDSRSIDVTFTPISASSWNRGEWSVASVENIFIQNAELYEGMSLYADVSSPMQAELYKDNPTDNGWTGTLRVFYDADNAEAPDEVWTANLSGGSDQPYVTAVTRSKEYLKGWVDEMYGGWYDFFEDTTRAVEITFNGNADSEWTFTSDTGKSFRIKFIPPMEV